MASVRAELVAAAARLLAEEGPDAVSARRLAQRVGTSTMAVYTQFGGMDQLRAELRRQAFAALAESLRAVSPRDDPVQRLTEQGLAYCRYASENPHLYRAAFAEPPLGGEDVEAGLAAFRVLVDSVEACVEAGRFEGDDANALAGQIWTATHGAVSLHLAGLLPFEQLIATVAALWESLGVAFGDERRRARESIAAARRVHPGAV